MLALVVAASACGLKTDPRGADQVRPKTISTLAAEPTPAGVKLSWTRTATYADGRRMDDLGGFLVFRGVPGQEAEKVGEIEVVDRDRFRTEKTFEFVDRGVTKGQTYYYRVISYTTDNYYSEPSNQVTVQLES
jgi:hypothetical protein